MLVSATAQPNITYPVSTLAKYCDLALQTRSPALVLVCTSEWYLTLVNTNYLSSAIPLKLVFRFEL